MLISGMGEFYFEVIKYCLLCDFNLNVKVYKLRVLYCEMIEGVVEVIGECYCMVVGK